MSLTYRLEAKQLTLGYESKTIVSDLNLKIPDGKVTVLVGANGCGKSTLLRGLARLLKPKRGKVYLDDADIFKLSTQAVARKIAMLPQSPTAPEGLTVKDLVVQGRYPYQTWWQQWSKTDEESVNHALAIADMLSWADQPLDQLSGGQQQRAWIAMTLAQETDILLLDEPTTFLDLAYQIEVLDLLHQLNQNAGRTIVMVLHDLNQACRYADYIVAIKDGFIHAQGKPAKVMNEEMVHMVFGLESKIISDPISGTPMCIPIGRRQM
jgi:iron complex transport system ATP-binding protein